MLFGKKSLATRTRPATSRGRRGVYPSPGLKETLEHLGGGGGPVLDLGPADDGTLSFLGELHYEVQVADLDAAALARGDALPYEREAYRAVLGWDILFRVQREQQSTLADTFAGWLQPGGVLFLLLPLDSRGLGWSYRFRILGPSRLEYRPGRALLADPVPSNREVLSLFPGLACNGARILRHGAREFVLRRPPAS